MTSSSFGVSYLLQSRVTCGVRNRLAFRSGEPAEPVRIVVRRRRTEWAAGTVFSSGRATRLLLGHHSSLVTDWVEQHTMRGPVMDLDEASDLATKSRRDVF